MTPTVDILIWIRIRINRNEAKMKVKIDPRKIKPLPDWAKEMFEEVRCLDEAGKQEEAKQLIDELRFKIRQND